MNLQNTEKNQRTGIFNFLNKYIVAQFKRIKLKIKTVYLQLLLSSINVRLDYKTIQKINTTENHKKVLLLKKSNKKDGLKKKHLKEYKPKIPMI